MPVTDLATLAQVRLWIPSGPSQQAPGAETDKLLSALITQVSTVVLGYLHRGPFLRTSFTDLYDGNGQNFMLLRRWPIVSIASLSINGVAFAAGSYPTAGYQLETWDGSLPGRMQRLSLRGNCFASGLQNIALACDAGYCVLGEAGTVPTGGGTIEVAQLNGPWMQDDGVSYNGAAFVKVTTAPAAGQYQLTPNAPGSYTFAAADAGKVVAISYSYIPAAINQGVCETVGERYRYRTRIGEASHSVPGPMTVSFSLKDIHDYVRMALDPYRNVVPM